MLPLCDKILSWRFKFLPLLRHKKSNYAWHLNWKEGNKRRKVFDLPPNLLGCILKKLGLGCNAAERRRKVRSFSSVRVSTHILFASHSWLLHSCCAHVKTPRVAIKEKGHKSFGRRNEWTKVIGRSFCLSRWKGPIRFFLLTAETIINSWRLPIYFRGVTVPCQATIHRCALLNSLKSKDEMSFHLLLWF